jgi:hypothetical protein
VAAKLSACRDPLAHTACYLLPACLYRPFRIAPCRLTPRDTEVLEKMTSGLHHPKEEPREPVPDFQQALSTSLTQSSLAP